MKIKKIFYSFCLLVILLLAQNSLAATVKPNPYIGRVLLATESKGDMWYVNPDDKSRYYIGRADDAIKIVDALGILINNKTYNAWLKKAPSAYSGKFLVNFEQGNIIYYVRTDNYALIKLGKGAEIYAALKKITLGVKNVELVKIPVQFNLKKKPGASTGSTVTPTKPTTSNPVVIGKPYVFSWKYNGKDYSMTIGMEASRYDQYRSSQKYYSYQGKLPDDWHDSYYAMFLKAKDGDSMIKDLVFNFKRLAKDNNLTSDQTVELAAGFVQSIPYDTAKVSKKDATPNYPYETVYTRLGICSDKALLMVALLREFGYGSAVIDLPDVNHAAAGVQCPSGSDVFGSGYCYIETTNYFPVGVVPQSISSAGIVSNKDFNDFKGQFDNVFNTSKLGSSEIYQKTKGQEYKGILTTKNRVEKLKNLEISLINGKKQISAYRQQLDAKKANADVIINQMNALRASGDNNGYSAMMPSYNQAVREYNDALGAYNAQATIYNANVADYNRLVGDFYAIK